MGRRNDHPAVTVNGMPLGIALRTMKELRRCADTPDTLAFAENGDYDDWRHHFDLSRGTFVDSVAVGDGRIMSTATPQAARALHRFEHDGITKIGSRMAAQLAGTFREDLGGVHRMRTWKRHRLTQYQPRESAS